MAVTLVNSQQLGYLPKMEVINILEGWERGTQGLGKDLLVVNSYFSSGIWLLLNHP